MPLDAQHSNDLRISEIHLDNQGSAQKSGENGDDLAEMEKLLNSGGAFGKQGDYRDTFKQMRVELENHEHSEQ